MTTEIIPYTTEEAWLAARERDITSTEIAALFGASPYRTAFELFHTKRGDISSTRADSPRMRWGRRLQDPIAHGVAEDHGLVVRKATEYIRDGSERIGSSFDFRIAAAQSKSEGLMEIKTVDAFEFRENWIVHEGDVLEAPAHIELQVQHQLLVSGLGWALIVALVGGNRVSVIERAYDATLGAAILKKVREFWSLVEAGTPPAPDYTRDGETLARLYRDATVGKTLDARTDEQLAAWVEHYQLLGEEIHSREVARADMRGRILERIRDAQRVILPHNMLSAGSVKATTVPAYTRAAYRNLRITHRKESIT